VLTMAPTDQGKIAPPAGDPEEHPPLSDPKSIFLGGLFVLALLATAFVAREIVLPLVFAIVLKLLLQPALRVLERLHIPRLLAALLLILGLFGTVAGLGTAISGPARTWAAKLPDGIPRLEERPCTASSRYSRTSAASAKSSRYRGRSNMTSPRIW
jgi:predicted PurR-regulated permease PerM